MYFQGVFPKLSQCIFTSGTTPIAEVFSTAEVPSPSPCMAGEGGGQSSPQAGADAPPPPPAMRPQDPGITAASSRLPPAPERDPSPSAERAKANSCLTTGPHAAEHRLPADHRVLRPPSSPLLSALLPHPSHPQHRHPPSQPNPWSFPFLQAPPQGCFFAKTPSAPLLGFLSCWGSVGVGRKGCRRLWGNGKHPKPSVPLGFTPPAPSCPADSSSHAPPAAFLSPPAPPPLPVCVCVSA